jgi:hypothetical protein
VGRPAPAAQPCSQTGSGRKSLVIGRHLWHDALEMKPVFKRFPGVVALVFLVLSPHVSASVCLPKSTSFSGVPYLNPNTGRFWTRDSFEGNQSDPLSLHKYLYCHASPLNGIDPSGHETLVSMNFTMAIMGQVNSMYLMSSSKALGAAQRISGSTDFGDLVYGLEVASIVQDKVSLVLAGAGLTMATAKIANFLANNAYKFANTSVRTLEELRLFASKPESYYVYKELRESIRAAGLSGTARGLEAHHLLEKRFASKLGVAEDDIIAVALTPSQHRNVGQMGSNIDSLIMDRLKQFGTTAENATLEQIWRAHRGVYDEMRHPEWAEAIYTAYFKDKGISFY